MLSKLIMLTLVLSSVSCFGATKDSDYLCGDYIVGDAVAGQKGEPLRIKKNGDVLINGKKVGNEPRIVETLCAISRRNMITYDKNKDMVETFLKSINYYVDKGAAEQHFKEVR